MKKRVLVLDIDGTLVNSQKEISAATKEAVQSVMKKGHKLILATGRCIAGVRKYEKELEMGKYDSYILAYNGGLMIHCKSGKIVEQKLLPLSLLPQLYAFAKEQGCGLITYEGNDIISAFPADRYVEIEAKMNRLSIREVEDFVQYVQFDINKCLLTADPDKAKDLVPVLQELFGDLALIYRAEPFFIEVMPQNVDKAASLDRMMELIGEKTQDMVCCGDGFNDVTMIRHAGIGVAMGNAQDVVKEVADFVTGTNDEDGLVEVIEKFF
jgi:Cof subfamily protein (haloacid dehalogenase superfamily)